MNRLLALFTVACPAALASFAAPSPASAQQVTPDFFSAMRWRSIGPYRAGNVYAVSGVPGDPTVYYLGLPEGGVWKTTDGGTVWKPIFDEEHVPSIGAVVAAPSNPEIVYVGTGDPTGWSFTPGKGVYKSTDAGKTWRNMGLEKTQYITSMFVDAHNPNLVLVGALGARQFGAAGADSAERGVFRSTDGGRTWKRTLYVDANTGISGMSGDAQDGRYVFATVQRGFRGGPAGASAASGVGIYSSSNGGATWKEIGGRGLPNGVRNFDVALASGTHGRRVYAEAQGNGRDASGLYRSDDGGATWTLATSQILSAGGPVYVDPKNPDVVYLTGTALYRSTDGGHHVEAYKGSAGGDDIRDMWIDPTNSRRMLLGVDQGPAISVDGGATWTPWYNLPNGQFYRVATDNHFPYRVCAPQQDSGTACVLSRSDFGAIHFSDWAPVGGFEDGFIVTDPLDDRWVYTQGWYHVLRRFDRATGQVAVLYTPTPEDRFGGAPPLAFSPQDPHTLYMAAQYVLASSDSARTWRRVSPDLTVKSDSTLAMQAGRAGAAVAPRRGRGASIQSLAPSTVASGEIWAGTSNDVIQLTRDGGTTWTNVSPTDLPARGAVNVIDASHHDAGTAYAAVLAAGDEHPYIYRTSDFGAHWQLIVTGMSDGAVRVVREDPVNPDVLYAGTVYGAWVSFDKGDHWQPLQLNLPTTVVSDIDVHGNDLVISTYGRGLWILDDVTPLREMHSATASSATSAYLYQPASAYRIRGDNIQDTPLPPEIPSGQNPPEGAIIDYYLAAPVRGPVTLSVYDSQHDLVRQFTSTAEDTAYSQPNIPTYWFGTPIVLSTAAGMHRIAWDLRYPPPPALNYGYYGGLLNYTEYTLNTHSITGDTPRQEPTGTLVAPGTYEVTLAAGGRTYTRNVLVKNDPRVLMSDAALDAQVKFERQIAAAMTVSYDEFNDIDRMRAVLARDVAQAHGKPNEARIVDAAHALDAQLAALASGPDGGFGPANRDMARHIEDMDFGDVEPTVSDRAATALTCRQIGDALTGLRSVRSGAGAAFNELARSAGLAPLPMAAVSASTGCGEMR